MIHNRDALVSDLKLALQECRLSVPAQRTLPRAVTTDDLALILIDHLWQDNDGIAGIEAAAEAILERYAMNPTERSPAEKTGEGA